MWYLSYFIPAVLCWVLTKKRWTKKAACFINILRTPARLHGTRRAIFQSLIFCNERDYTKRDIHNSRLKPPVPRCETCVHLDWLGVCPPIKHRGKYASSVYSTVCQHLKNDEKKSELWMINSTGLLVIVKSALLYSRLSIINPMIISQAEAQGRLKL